MRPAASVSVRRPSDVLAHLIYIWVRPILLDRTLLGFGTQTECAYWLADSQKNLPIGLRGGDNTGDIMETSPQEA